VVQRWRNRDVTLDTEACADIPEVVVDAMRFLEHDDRAPRLVIRTRAKRRHAALTDLNRLDYRHVVTSPAPRFFAAISPTT